MINQPGTADFESLVVIAEINWEYWSNLRRKPAGCGQQAHYVISTNISRSGQSYLHSLLIKSQRLFTVFFSIYAVDISILSNRTVCINQ